MLRQQETQGERSTVAISAVFTIQLACTCSTDGARLRKRESNLD